MISMISILFFRTTTFLRYEWPDLDMSTPPSSVEHKSCEIQGFKKHTQTAKLWGLGVEAAYYGHLNLVEYFVEKSGAEPSKVRSLTLEVSLTHSFFMNHFNSKRIG